MSHPDFSPALPTGSHRRYNPLQGSWVLISPHRLDRPWQGATGAPARPPAVSYDPGCYLCPGNERAGGASNPGYEGVYVFDNDFPALRREAEPQSGTPSHALFRAEPEVGTCRVVCFSPDHSKTLSALTVDEVEAVVQMWVAQSAELGARYPEGAVQIFENKGELMGCSNPHPHGQIWAQASVPDELREELARCAAYRAEQGRALLMDYCAAECADGARLVCSNDDFVALVPYWATWPYEVLILPRAQHARLATLSRGEHRAFADIVQRLSVRYDNLFCVSFPYSAGIHQAPLAGGHDDSFTLHMHFYPPLLRSAEVRKFMVGYEMLAEPQRDLTPEAAAQMLRSQPETLIQA
jgi:UDPglucose--hexose-1-phosphate uridylyltransferase